MDRISQNRKYLDEIEAGVFPEMALRHLAEAIIQRLCERNNAEAKRELERISSLSLHIERELCRK